MKLAYLTNQYPKVSHTFVRREILALERRGHEVLRLAIRSSGESLADPADRAEREKTIVCLAEGAFPLLMAALRVALSRPIATLRALSVSVSMHRASERGVLRHLAYLAEAAFLLPILERHAVEHVHVHFGTNSTAVARLIRTLGGPSYSMTIHGPTEFDAPIGLSLGAKMRDALFVVAISHYCQSQLRRWLAPELWSKIEIVRCGVDAAFIESNTPVLESSKTLVSVGRLAPQKGHMVLLEAFHKVVQSEPDARLVLVGDGELREITEAKIRELGLESHVEITGWADEATVRSVLASSRALVMPSFAEGLPVVAMEAYALGRPVVSSSIAGVPELIRHGENGWLVVPSDVDDLEKALLEVLRTSATRLDAMAAAGRRRVTERHDADREAERLEAILRDRLAARSSP